MTVFCLAGRILILLPLLTECARPMRSIVVDKDDEAREDSGTRHVVVSQRGHQFEGHRHPEAGLCSTIVPGSMITPFGSFCMCPQETAISGTKLKCVRFRDFDAWPPYEPDQAGCRCESVTFNDDLASHSQAEIIEVVREGRRKEWDELLVAATSPSSDAGFVHDSLLTKLVHFTLLGNDNPNSTRGELRAATSLLLLVGTRHASEVVKLILAEVRKWPCGKRGGVFRFMVQLYSQNTLISDIRSDILRASIDFFKSQTTCLQSDGQRYEAFITEFELACVTNGKPLYHATIAELLYDWDFTTSTFLHAMAPLWGDAHCTAAGYKEYLDPTLFGMFRDVTDFVNRSEGLADYRVAPLVIQRICAGQWGILLNRVRVSGSERRVVSLKDNFRNLDKLLWNASDNGRLLSVVRKYRDDDEPDPEFVHLLQGLLTSKVASQRAVFAYVLSAGISTTTLSRGELQRALSLTLCMKRCQAEISDLLGDPDKNVRFAGAHLLGSIQKTAQLANVTSAFDDVLNRSRIHTDSISEILSDPQSSHFMLAGVALLTAFISDANEKDAERLRADAQWGLNTSRELSKQVGVLIACTDKDISAPPGFMVVAHNSSSEAWGTVQAFRCPQPRACIGTRSLRKCSEGAQSMCAQGYDSTVPGCASCEGGFGRQPLDPVTCRPCGRHELLQKAGYVIPPTILVAFGMRSASRAKRDLAGGLLNIVLSFAMSAFILVSALEETQAFQTLRDSAKSAMQITSRASGAASALYSSSFDCLMGEKLTTLTDWMMLSMLMPFLLLLVCLLAMLLTPTSPFSNWRLKLLRPTLVAGNTFLPGVLAACVRFGACIHLQEDGRSVRAYEMSRTCSSENRDFAAILGIFLAACTLGPIYWALLIHKAKHWDPRVEQEIVGYLINSYKEESQWWGAVMLLRKLALATVTAVLPIGYAPKSHIGAATVIMVASLIGHVFYRPFKSAVLNVVEGCSLAATCTSMAIADFAIGGEQNWSTTLQSGRTAVVLALVIVALNGIILSICFLLAFFVPAGSSTERMGPLLRRLTVY